MYNLIAHQYYFYYGNIYIIKRVGFQISQHPWIQFNFGNHHKFNNVQLRTLR